MDAGRLYLVPNIIADGTHDKVIPPYTLEVLGTIRHFLAEDVRTARRYFSSLRIFPSIEELQFSVLNKDTSVSEIASLLAPLRSGNNVGIISESGCPGIADPGALAVELAHKNGWVVTPLVGPSSILLALMASGLNGQQFAFNGYLPVDASAAAKVIGELERESRARNRTQIFIETPYRNNALLKNLLTTLHPQTKVCIALDLTSPTESVITRSVEEWKRQKVTFPKIPAIFMFLA
jgi:16S rRNA (cytidine1402-2'-O)-methyltransferase